MVQVITRSDIMGHLKITDRLKIETLLSAGHKQSFISQQLNRSESVISQEVNTIVSREATVTIWHKN